MEIIDKTLPDYCWKQKDMASIDTIVIHYFSGLYVDPEHKFDMQICYDLFLDLNLPDTQRHHVMKPGTTGQRSYGSAHYLVGREGECWSLVPLPKIAWHAGVSEWKGRKYCNNFAVGIETVATYDSGYTDEQYETLIELCVELMNKYQIAIDNITGHEFIAPGRKKDPGPKFDWDRLKSGIRDKLDKSFMDQITDLF